MRCGETRRLGNAAPRPERTLLQPRAYNTRYIILKIRRRDDVGKGKRVLGQRFLRPTRGPARHVVPETWTHTHTHAHILYTNIIRTRYYKPTSPSRPFPPRRSLKPPPPDDSYTHTHTHMHLILVCCIYKLCACVWAHIEPNPGRWCRQQYTEEHHIYIWYVITIITIVMYYWSATGPPLPETGFGMCVRLDLC